MMPNYSTKCVWTVPVYNQTWIPLCEWSMQWQLKFNTDKCTVMHFGSHNDQKQYILC